MTNTIPLNISKNSTTGRIMVGLSWDMRDLKKIKISSPEFIQNLGIDGEFYAKALENQIHAIRSTFFYKDSVFGEGHTNNKDDHNVRNTDYEQFDLDLECYIFDKNGNIVIKISPDYTEIHNEDMSVFHSSEDYTGVGAFDDEDISLLLTKLPENYHSILFVVKSDCAFDLDQILNPQIRIYDAFSNEESLKINIKPDIANASAYIFANLYRIDDGWAIQKIDRYCQYEDNFEEIFKKEIMLR